MRPYILLTVPDTRLRKKASSIEKVDKSVREIFERMLLTMNSEEGIGLAATQVGIDKRLIVMNIHEHDDEDEDECHHNENSCENCKIYYIANPEIIYSSDELEPSTEGCLSVPGQRAEIMRAKSIKIQYLDENNNKQTLEGEGLLSYCIQHEIDHLNGILFVDHLSAIKRKLLIQKAKKYAAAQKEE